MNNKPNIFQKLASENDTSTFSAVTSVPEAESSGNIFEQLAAQENKKKENQFSFLQTVRDIGEQVATKGLSGAVGAYGNILDATGLQLKPGQSLPGEQARNSAQFQVLEKLERGEVPSANELMLLSDDDIGTINRLPTSKEVQKEIENITGIGEGKTSLGRVAGRGAEFVGEGALTGGGSKALTALGLSGLAGQTLRETGASEMAATGVEIGGALLPSVVSKKLLPTGTTQKQLVDAGRRIGLSEAQITPLIQGEKKTAAFSKLGKKGSKTKKLFSSIKEQLGDSYNNLKNSNAAKVKIPTSQQMNLSREFGNIRRDLSKTLAPSPDRQAALDFIDKAFDGLLQNNITPEYLINFWQDINKSVKWNSINGGKKALAQLKKPVLEALEKTNPALAKDFEMTNQLYSKYAQISKKLKPDIVDSFLNKGEMIAAIPSGMSLVMGNPWPLTGLATESAVRLLGREMLINPYFQNISNKLVKNFNSGSVKSITETVKQVRDFMDRKHPQEDWAFLTEEI